MARGVVPWTTLGLPLEQVQDGYARMFTYNVTTAATVTTLTTGTIGGVLGNMTVHTATPAAMGLPVVAGRNQINSCWIGAGAPAATENSCGLNAVVILLSHGENGSGAVTSQGGALPAPTDAAEVENTDADAAFVKSDPTSTGFDDVLFAWSPDELIEPLARRLTVKSGAALSNETLRTTALAVSTAILNAATNCAAPPCGPGNWPTALIPTAPAIPAPPTCQTVQGVNLPTDAWGNCLVYANVTAGGTNICGTTGGSFTITSPGIDGLITVAPATNANTGRNDDFVITVTVDQIRSQLGTRFGAC